MSVLPDMGLPNTMSEAEYEALPAGVARLSRTAIGWPALAAPAATTPSRAASRRSARR